MQTWLFRARALFVLVPALLTTAAFAGVNVTVSSPMSGTHLTSPFSLSAKATGSKQITGWYIYSDNVAAWHTSGPASSINASVGLGTGSHTLRVRAWQADGAYGDYVLTVSVNGASSPPPSGLPTPPSSAKVWTQLESTTDNWTDCSPCAGGAHDTSNYWTAAFQTRPSVDGSSREFYNGGGDWTNVLWTKHLGNQSWASHFLWDFWVQFDSATAANIWTAEYDLYQSVSHQEFMIGSQCNFGAGVWDTWDSQHNNWKHTSVSCKRFSGGTWHHIQWYVERVSSTQYRYVTLVVDGVAHAINQTYHTNSIGWSDSLGVQWQLDQSSHAVQMHEWIDSVKLSIW